MIRKNLFYRMRRDLHILLAVLLVLSLILPAGAIAATTSSATIIEFTGDVQIVRGGSETSFAAFHNMRLTEGDRIITGANSSAKIELENDNAVLTLTENTRIYLSELKGQGDDQQTTVNLQAGGLGSKVKKALSKVSRFNIKTPTAAMGVRGTHFYTQYQDGLVDIRVLTGLVDVTIGADPRPVDEDAGDDPGGLPADSGLDPDDPDQTTDPDDPALTDPEAGTGPTSYTYTLGALQQLGFHEDDSPDDLGGLVVGAFSLGGLDESFIGDLEEEAEANPGILPEGLLDDAEAAKEAARERARERQAREGQAPREQDENPGERSKEIARSKPATEEDQAPDIIDQTPQSIPAGDKPSSTATPPTSPAPTYDDDDDDYYYEPTPPREPEPDPDPKPEPCPDDHYKVTFEVIGEGGSIYAALIETEGQAISGNCYPEGSQLVFTALPDSESNYVVKEWIINGERFEMDVGVPYPGQMLEGLELWQDLNITLEFKLDEQSTPQYKLTYSVVDNIGGTLRAQTNYEMPLDSGSYLDGETGFFFIAEADTDYTIKQWLINDVPFEYEGEPFVRDYLDSGYLEPNLLKADLDVQVEFEEEGSQSNPIQLASVPSTNYIKTGQVEDFSYSPESQFATANLINYNEESLVSVKFIEVDYSGSEPVYSEVDVNDWEEAFTIEGSVLTVDNYFIIFNNPAYLFDEETSLSADFYLYFDGIGEALHLPLNYTRVDILLDIDLERYNYNLTLVDGEPQEFNGKNFYVLQHESLQIATDLSVTTAPALTVKLDSDPIAGANYKAFDSNDYESTEIYYSTFYNNGSPDEIEFGSYNQLMFKIIIPEDQYNALTTGEHQVTLDFDGNTFELFFNK